MELASMVSRLPTVRTVHLGALWCLWKSSDIMDLHGDSSSSFYLLVLFIMSIPVSFSLQIWVAPFKTTDCLCYFFSLFYCAWLIFLKHSYLDCCAFDTSVGFFSNYKGKGQLLMLTGFYRYFSIFHVPSNDANVLFETLHMITDFWIHRYDLIVVIDAVSKYCVCRCCCFCSMDWASTETRLR